MNMKSMFLANKKLTNLKTIITKSNDLIAKYEEWMLNHYYYVDHKLIKKLAPAKSIVASLEIRLDEINKSPQGFFKTKLQQLINEKFEIKDQAIKVLLFRNGSSIIPNSITLEQSYQILDNIFKTIELEIKRIERQIDNKQFNKSSDKTRINRTKILNL